MGSRTLVEGGTFFEGPRWHDGRWWASDFYRHAVLSWAEDGSDERVELTVDAQPSGLGWYPDGSLVVVSMLDRRLLRRSPDGEVTEVASFGEHCGGPANDMVVDGAGRAYIGNFGFDLMANEHARRANLVRVDPDGTVAVVADGLEFPNGSVVTPDGSTLIVGETTGSRYTAFTIAQDGSLHDRRVWAEVPGIGPDGCCLDAEGHIWIADAFGRGCVLVEEGGTILGEVPPPDGLGVFACMLGGADGRTLLQCCAPDYLAHERQRSNDAVLVAVEVDVPGAGWP
jgi:sugar lactone lactonase YvrE